MGKTSAEWVEALNANGVPSGPILNIKEMFENEQVKHLGLAVRQPSRARRDAGAGPPVDAVAHARRRPPGRARHGEHTDEILKELGYSAEDIKTLRKDAAV